MLSRAQEYQDRWSHAVLLELFLAFPAGAVGHLMANTIQCNGVGLVDIVRAAGLVRGLLCPTSSCVTSFAYHTRPLTLFLSSPRSEPQICSGRSVKI